RLERGGGANSWRVFLPPRSCRRPAFGTGGGTKRRHAARKRRTASSHSVVISAQAEIHANPRRTIGDLDRSLPARSTARVYSTFVLQLPNAGKVNFLQYEPSIDPVTGSPPLSNFTVIVRSLKSSATLPS